MLWVCKSDFKCWGISLFFFTISCLKLLSAWLLSAGFRPLLLGSVRADPHPARHELINFNQQPVTVYWLMWLTSFCYTHAWKCFVPFCNLACTLTPPRLTETPQKKKSDILLHLAPRPCLCDSLMPTTEGWSHKSDTRGSRSLNQVNGHNPI